MSDTVYKVSDDAKKALENNKLFYSEIGKEIILFYTENELTTLATETIECKNIDELPNRLKTGVKLVKRKLDGEARDKQYRRLYRAVAGKKVVKDKNIIYTDNCTQKIMDSKLAIIFIPTDSTKEPKTFNLTDDAGIGEFCTSNDVYRKPGTVYLVTKQQADNFGNEETKSKVEKELEKAKETTIPTEKGAQLKVLIEENKAALKWIAGGAAVAVVVASVAKIEHMDDKHLKLLAKTIVDVTKKAWPWIAGVATKVFYSAAKRRSREEAEGEDIEQKGNPTEPPAKRAKT